MRLPIQCLPNTGRIRFFPILSCPCDVKLSYRHAALAVCDVTVMTLPRCMDLPIHAVFDEALPNCLRQFEHHLVCI